MTGPGVSRLEDRRGSPDLDYLDRGFFLNDLQVCWIAIPILHNRAAQCIWHPEHGLSRTWCVFHP